MPLLDLQKQGRQIGRIRIGAMGLSKSGSKRPTKLDTFRLTTGSRVAADSVAEHFGGTVHAWAPGQLEDDGTGRQWEVVTDVTELPIVIPPGEPINQWYEMWSGGGCVRRCDGFTEQLRQSPCLCPEGGVERAEAAQTGKACKPKTRINVILPDLAGLGVWRFDTGSYYAALEISDTARLLQAAAESGTVLPARLRLEQRERKVIDVHTNQQQTKQFPVVVIDVDLSMRQILTGQGPRSFAEALPTRTDREALPAGSMPELTAKPARTPGAVPTSKAPLPTSDPSGQMSPDTIAAKALATASARVVTALKEAATTAGVLDELVTGTDGVLTELGDLLDQQLGRL
jgi:hypothetical protein